jgi:DNA-binding response OmpR family regulator
MTQLKLGDIDALLVEPNAQMRRALRDGLIGRGFDRVVTVSSLAEAQAACGERSFDVVVCDACLAEPGGAGLPRAIRHGETGDNPFLVIVGTLLNTDTSAVGRLIEEGVDNILAKPFSVHALLDRITAMIHARKPFVVTADYIGPDRRGATRPQTSLPLIAVPNTLRDKALDAYNPAAARAAIAEARGTVGAHKLIQNALQANSLAQEIVGCYASQAADESAALQLDALAGHVRAIGRGVAGTPDAHIAELCDSMLRVIHDIRLNHPRPAAKDVQLLQNLAQAIHLAFRPDERIAALSKDIAGSVSRAKRRSAAGD